MADLDEIIRRAPMFLKQDGWLAMEHGFEQGEAVRELFVDGGFREVQTLDDLAGLPRVTEGQVRPSVSRQND